MAGVFEALGSILTDAYESLTNILPPFATSFISFFLIAVLLVISAIIIYKFYKSVARKNLIHLDLAKYNKSTNPLFVKLVAGLLYFIEYVLILPFFIFLWFVVLTIFLLLLTERTIETLLLVSATLIAAIRMTSYYSQDLSKDLAKLVPFTLLATSLLTPNFFSVERVLGQIALIPNVFGNVFYYLLFIVILEIVLRSFELFGSLFESEEPKVKKKGNKKDEE